MADTTASKGNEAHYLRTTADMFGWAVRKCTDGSVRMTRTGRTVWAWFSSNGTFRYGGADGPDGVVLPLRMRQVLDVLESRPPV